MIYWIFLALAIITEVIGTLSMKHASVSGDFTGMAVMYVMIASSYILLAVAVKKLPLGLHTPYGKGSVFYLSRRLVCCGLASRFPL